MKIEIERVDLKDIVNMLKEYNKIIYFHSVQGQINRLETILRENMADKCDKCDKCAKWALGCELDGDFRRYCIKKNYYCFLQKTNEIIEYENINNK